MLNGFYSIYFTGLVGVGFGVIILKDGIIMGVDGAGATYDGNYEIDNTKGFIKGKIILKAPPGLQLVTGASSGSEPGRWEIPLILPSDLGNEKPLSIKTPTGPINVIFRKLRDF